MIKGIYTTGSGMLPQMSRIEIIGNNLANMNTVGFKKDQLFTEILKKEQKSLASTNGVQGLPTIESIDFSEGSFQQTGNTLDFAISGDGFFTIETPQGIRYTRNGSFTLSLDGALVTKEGYPVLGTEGKIQLPDIQKLSQGDINVNETGEITIDKRQFGKFQLAAFDDMTVLKKDGSTNFRVEDGTKVRLASESNYKLHQGFLEESNVEGLDEMVVMIELSRNFESGQKSMQAQDETIERLLDLGRV